MVDGRNIGRIALTAGRRMPCASTAATGDRLPGFRYDRGPPRVREWC
jgi:hypothetical protein